MTLSERVSPSLEATFDNNNPVCLPISLPPPPPARVSVLLCGVARVHWRLLLTADIATDTCVTRLAARSQWTHPMSSALHTALHCHMSLVSNSLGYQSHCFFVLTECLLNRNNDVNNTKLNFFRNAGLWPPLFPSPAFFHTQVASHHRRQRTWPATLAPAPTRPPLSRPRPRQPHWGLRAAPASWPPSWRTRSAAAAATRRTLRRCPVSSNTAVSTAEIGKIARPCVRNNDNSFIELTIKSKCFMGRSS